MESFLLEHGVLVIEKTFNMADAAAKYVVSLLEEISERYFNSDLVWMYRVGDNAEWMIGNEKPRIPIETLSDGKESLRIIGCYRSQGEGFAVSFAELNVDERAVSIRLIPVLSLERYILYLLIHALAFQATGTTPSIPLWLSPIQVRIIPVKPEHKDYAEKIAAELAEKGFRVDIDDRSMGLGKRIREAGRQWIPYIVIVGSREVESGTLNIRVRRTNDQFIASIDEFVERLDSEMNHHTRNPLHYVPCLSETVDDTSKTPEP
jgi:hypothetical protein